MSSDSISNPALAAPQIGARSVQGTLVMVGPQPNTIIASGNALAPENLTVTGHLVAGSFFPPNLIIGPPGDITPQLGTLTINRNAAPSLPAPPPPMPAVPPPLRIIGATGQNTRLLIDYFAGAGAGTYPLLTFRAAMGSPEAMQPTVDQQRLGIISFRGCRNPGEFSGDDAAYLQCRATEDWASTTMGNCLEFFTSSSGGGGAVRLTIGSGIVIGNPVGGDQGVGTINVQSDIYLNGVKVEAGDPDSAGPGYRVLRVPN